MPFTFATITKTVTEQINHKFKKGDLIQQPQFGNDVYEVAEVVIDRDGNVRYKLNYTGYGYQSQYTKPGSPFGCFNEKGDIERYELYTPPVPKVQGVKYTLEVTLDHAFAYDVTVPQLTSKALKERFPSNKVNVRLLNDERVEL